MLRFASGISLIGFWKRHRAGIKTEEDRNYF